MTCRLELVSMNIDSTVVQSSAGYRLRRSSASEATPINQIACGHPKGRAESVPESYPPSFCFGAYFGAACKASSIARRSPTFSLALSLVQ